MKGGTCVDVAPSMSFVAWAHARLFLRHSVKNTITSPEGTYGSPARDRIEHCGSTGGRKILVSNRARSSVTVVLEEEA